MQLSLGNGGHVLGHIPAFFLSLHHIIITIRAAHVLVGMPANEGQSILHSGVTKYVIIINITAAADDRFVPTIRVGSRRLLRK